MAVKLKRFSVNMYSSINHCQSSLDIGFCLHCHKKLNDILCSFFNAIIIIIIIVKGNPVFVN